MKLNVGQSEYIRKTLPQLTQRIEENDWYAVEAWFDEVIEMRNMQEEEGVANPTR